MRKVRAMVRAAWLSALSYRVETFFSFTGLFISLLPLYFISRALQPMMAGVIHAEAPEYFGFLVVGLITFGFVQTAVGALHGALGGEISTGSFEALLSTPTSLPAILTGMVGQAFSMSVIRSALVFCAALAYGAHVVWSGGPAAIAVLILIVLAYLPLGLISAALVLAFRTTGPFPGGVLAASALLGGVYYPSNVVPSWLQGVSAFVPLRYGLHALRRSLLDGASLSSSVSDLSMLVLFSVVFFVFGIVAFLAALRYAKSAGTLAQY